MSGSPSFSSTLYDCATECALRRQKRRCREWFGSFACNNCRFNVNRYIDADPRQVELFMLQAETRAYSMKRAGGNYHLVFIILIGFCIYSAWTGYKAEQERAARLAEWVQPKTTASSATTRTISVTSEHSNIEATLRKVAKDLEAKTDVNGDGLVNCIDAAVLFYKYYPNRDKVCIELNRNATTGMHHLFNCVLTDGVWKAIEPQAYYTGKRSYLMSDIWGSQYDYTKNKDATAEYSRFAR